MCLILYIYYITLLAGLLVAQECTVPYSYKDQLLHYYMRLLFIQSALHQHVRYVLHLRFAAKQKFFRAEHGGFVGNPASLSLTTS